MLSSLKQSDGVGSTRQQFLGHCRDLLSERILQVLKTKLQVPVPKLTRKEEKREIKTRKHNGIVSDTVTEC